MNEDTRDRLRIAFGRWRQARTEVELSRGSLQQVLEEAIARGARKAEVARELGVSRQEIEEYLRWGGRRKR